MKGGRRFSDLLNNTLSPFCSLLLEDAAGGCLSVAWLNKNSPSRYKAANLGIGTEVKEKRDNAYFSAGSTVKAVGAELAINSGAKTHCTHDKPAS